MRLFSILGLLLFSPFISAQSFSEKIQHPPFAKIFNGDIAFADVDGDDDEDLLITGLDRANTGGGLDVSTILYINDGQGNFTRKVDTPFEGVASSSVAFADVDGDSDLDVLITGTIRTFDDRSVLYLNDGTGNFTEDTGTPFDGVSSSSIAFADVDGDNDPDVFITGNQEGIPTARLYLNDGKGGFTEVPNTPFEPVSEGSIAFADVDGDNDPDVLISGGRTGVPTPYLYYNDDSGNFTKVANSPFPPVDRSSIAFADVDGNNTPDVLISGFDVAKNKPVTALFTNDGTGGYSEVPNTPFEPVSDGSVAFADVDGDNDPDVLITGINSGIPTTKLYINNGSGDFSEASDTPFTALAYGSVVFADVDGDSDPDFVISGTDSAGTETTKLYVNDRIVSSTKDPFSGSVLDLVVYPNPAATDLVHVRFNAAGEGSIKVKVHDFKGTLVGLGKQGVSRGLQNLAVDISNLSTGIYFIKVEEGNRTGEVRIFVQ